MKLDPKDLLTGYVYGLVSFFVVGWWCAAVGVLTALLWALGGAGWLGFNTWRRLGCPAFISCIFAGAHHSLKPLISIPLQFGALCIGYGIPDVNDPQGSALGRAFGKWTRVAWFLILAAAMSPLFLR